MREAGQVLVKRPRTPTRRRVQHLEQPRHPRAEVRTIGGRALLNELEEDVARLEDPGVVGEQAEHGPNQEQLQVVTVVAGRFQRVVQAGDQLGRLDVDRILIAECTALHADDEPELLDVLRKVGEREAGLLALVAVDQLERLEIAQQLEARAVPLRKRVEVRAGLIACGGQVAPGALLLDQQDAGPEQVDEAGGVVEPFDVFLVPRHGAPSDAEDIEEVVVEALGSRPSRTRRRPTRGRSRRRGARISFQESLIDAACRHQPRRRRAPHRHRRPSASLRTRGCPSGRRVPRPDATLPSRTTPSGRAVIPARTLAARSGPHRTPFPDPRLRDTAALRPFRPRGPCGPRPVTRGPSVTVRRLASASPLGSDGTPPSSSSSRVAIEYTFELRVDSPNRVRLEARHSG